MEELRVTHSTREAVDIYQDMVEVPGNMSEALKIYVWEKLAAEELPKGTIEIVVDPLQQQVPLFPADQRPRKPRRIG